MMKRAMFALLLAGVLLASSTTYAHHSFASTYDETKKITVEGKLVQFLFRNPHSFVHVMAPDEDGTMQRWAIEWGGAGQLGGQGVTRETLKPGDKVIITGNPGRNPADHRVRMVTLRRPSDGFGWGNKDGETFD
jgi:Family of unknown function (DUF6152)